MAGSGAFEYRPSAGFAGHDSFTYQVCDNGDNPGPLCDTATVFRGDLAGRRRRRGPDVRGDARS